ncbi:hypothetical protein AK830_g2854 [Neonectria ditissima]|uniref:EXPERA domain-containing protein n=1 Tax=Neonectria ditissima TaxID=78410 RepID=A0A0P7BA67_9HYPO|nr:hypothetical protein AK830_g2854 [Neonectria ditissima]
MVSTRASSRAASAAPESTPPPPDPASALPPAPATPSTSTRRRSAASKQSLSTTTTKRRPGRPSSSSAASPSSAWAHTPTTLTLLWLAVSVPLVVWDTGYILGRPRTFEGGDLHWPLWVPYRLYAQIDHVYSRIAWDNKNGFSGAQSALNAVEIVLYLVYMFLFWSRATPASKNARSSLGGRRGALAVLVGFSAAVMTLSKTLLYFAHEYYSGYHNIGHNTARDLITLWVLPNVPWIVVPAYMIYALGGNILDGLTLASDPSRK